MCGAVSLVFFTLRKMADFTIERLVFNHFFTWLKAHEALLNIKHWESLNLYSFNFRWFHAFIVLVILIFAFTDYFMMLYSAWVWFRTQKSGL